MMDPNDDMNLKDVNEAFGVDSKAEADAEDPLPPHRKRTLLLACACILGALIPQPTTLLVA